MSTHRRRSEIQESGRAQPEVARGHRQTGRQFGNFSPVPCATFEGAAPGDVRVTSSAGGREIARFLARTGFLPEQTGASGAPADRPSVLTKLGRSRLKPARGSAPK